MLAVYGQTLGFGFVDWDDGLHVVDNLAIRDGFTRMGVAWAFRSGETGNWHPLTWLSHMLDAELYGLEAGGHHATSVALHVLNTLLLFGVLRAATAARWRSAFAAGLFGLHPLHVESVAWISERRDVLSTLFGLLAIGAYIGWTRRGGAARYGGVLLLQGLSLSAKPMLVTLPCVLLLLDVWPLRRSRPLRLVLEKLPLFALAAAASAAAFALQRRAGSMDDAQALPLVLRAANATVAYVSYLIDFAWPSGLAIFYPHPYLPNAGGTGLPVWQIFSALLLLLAATLVILRARGFPYLAVGWLWFLGTLVPVIGLVQIGSQARADRYTYFPSIGLCLAFAWAAADLAVRSRHARARRLAAALACLLLLALGAGAWRQTRHWRDSRSLFQHAVDVVPRNPSMRFNLANALRDGGSLDAAMREYSLALEQTTDAAEIRTNLANVLRLRGRDAEAEALYREAFAQRPEALAGYNLGNLLREHGRIAEAIDVYRRALEHRPRDAKLHNNLATLLAQTGAVDAAIHHYGRALELDPGYETARQNLDALRRVRPQAGGTTP